MPYDTLIRDPSLPVAKPTTSYWQTPPHEKLLHVQSAQLPAECDIAVIGSGISACSTVRELLVGGYKGTIAVLEARELCSGATGRNGGRIHVHAMKDYDAFRRRFGDDAAKKIVRFQMMHRPAIEAAVKTLRPEHQNRAALRDTESVAAVFSEAKLAQTKTLLANFEAAFPDCAGQWRLISGEEAQKKYKIKNATGAVVHVAGAAWPYRLITDTFQELQEKYPDQLSLDSNTPVLRVSKNPAPGPGYLVSTPRGTVKAKHVVYCTEAHTAHLLPKLTGIIVPRRGQMTVQRPGQNFEHLAGKRSFNFNWDQGHDYLHQNPETGDLIIGGGEHGGVSGSALTYGQRSDDVEILPDKIHLSGLMRVVFGQQDWGEVPAGSHAIKASWSGILGQSLDHVPLVGLLPQEALHDRRVGDPEKGAEWIAVGFGGYGMTNCWLSGVALARQILGQVVPEWFPEQFVASSSRLVRLQDQVETYGGTERHLRALL
ncbi:hypothetical protein SEUCBS139899_003356 [Sporothrix eucalyptigena]|uniref:FAD dependent oxidoreductase domain-containing protein n=1 Tax=Sporothrix eucalyptigena TaxID=1812306 RepID=A0ABP0CCX2_9PEZI